MGSFCCKCNIRLHNKICSLSSCSCCRASSSRFTSWYTRKVSFSKEMSVDCNSSLTFAESILRALSFGIFKAFCLSVPVLVDAQQSRDGARMLGSACRWAVVRVCAMRVVVRFFLALEFATFFEARYCDFVKPSQRSCVSRNSGHRIPGRLASVRLRVRNAEALWVILRYMPLTVVRSLNSRSS